MPTTQLTAAVADGRALATLITPDGDAPLPLIVFYPDAGGLRAAMTQLGERFAAAGYAVLEVDPFWREGAYAPFDVNTVWTDPTERARLFAMLGRVNPEQVMGDTRALIAAIDDPRVERARAGTIGYCLGGRLAFLAAAMMPDLVVAAAPIHAGGLVGADEKSPHLRAPQIRAALYIGVADQDSSCTPEHQAALRAALEQAGVRHQIELYPGAKHGFAVPDFPVYDAAASEQHVARALALFGAHLRGGGG